MSEQHGVTLRGSASHAKQEWRYFTQRSWSVKDVGEFWSSVTDYDDINEGTYSYFRRFTNSLDLAEGLIGPDNLTLDIQARKGQGSAFWAERGFVRKAHVVDFSERMLTIASSRLAGAGVEFETHLVLNFPLPFADDTFDLILSYETIEHIWEHATFVRELARVLRPGQWLILTCPNVLWEPAHWLSAILNIHHSEGPHRFLRRSSLLSLFESNSLRIASENTTIILPFSSASSMSVDRLLERWLPDRIKRTVALRRSFVLQKGEP